MIEPAEQRERANAMVEPGGPWWTREGLRQVASASGPGSGQGAGAAHMPAGTFKSGASS